MIKNIFTKNKPEKTDDSVNYEVEIREKFTSDPTFPFLVSFPRTGSHWLRMLMELYFEKPALSRAFVFKNIIDFTCYHRHDNNLSIERENVIYLYRAPVPTVYSQLNYYNEDINDTKKIKYWTEEYVKHLEKWLIIETFTKKKTIISYEGLKNNIFVEFKKITDHFGTLLDTEKLDNASVAASKEALKIKTQHDKKVVTISKNYETQRNDFKRNHKDFIMSIIKDENITLYNLIYS
ncbi:MAG: sulfotransferase domain-containing protein [Desulfobacterales bacterium]|nr:sulfotransferase domain-containing protein [Desulfobacterales bacterium]